MASETQTKSSIRSIKAESTRTNQFQNKHYIRDFDFLIDEPEKLGGLNQAMTPMEYILGSFNGCLMIVIEMVAKENALTIEHLTSSSIGTVDREGLLGTADVSPHFQQVTLKVEVTFAEVEIDAHHLIYLVKKRCPAFNLFKDAGIEIELIWEINKEVQS
ncbi:OsmC family protein [Halobacillus sp. Marseille-Q1614]|uniref:OsmC family protein n=1 Tax=Halobacillus sp. Marseille-Q1614 TaxID=2709134 RepID=UPI0015709F89|nr:OsmC family protein [Halobacillus sp. Marseille-Q1614]